MTFFSIEEKIFSVYVSPFSVSSIFILFLFLIHRKKVPEREEMKPDKIPGNLSEVFMPYWFRREERAVWQSSKISTDIFPQRIPA